VYTALSYFNKGLTEAQLKEAVLELQSLGIEAQKAVHREWIRSVQNGAAPGDLPKFDDPNKIDVNNAVQFDLVYENLRYCMETICFWTNSFVYPKDTSQFLSKRATSAWNVSDPGNSVGFSGTDDNRFLLPLSIAHISPDEDHLQATNGEMVRRVLDCSQQVKLLEDNSAEHTPMWQLVLNVSLSLGVDALIDVAGLMAGSDNYEVALFLADRFERESFRGVVYFDTERNAWHVYEVENRRQVPLDSSSFTESECYVYFDESRCRGSDMKLQTVAVALVTLDPKMTKDKFLQGCLRMRKLRVGGQSLILAGTSEVVSSDSTAKDILEKILHRTAATRREGVATYHEHGCTYDAFPKPTTDDFALGAMYASAVPNHNCFSDFLDARHENEKLSKPVEALVAYCKNIGQGAHGSSRLSEECEQELEHEVEHEVVEERSDARQDPYEQTDWAFETAFSNPAPLFGTLFLSIKDFIRDKLSILSGIPWSSQLYATPNFLRTIETMDSAQQMSCYLRPVNAMLVLPDGRVVLLSAYELDKLLPLWWRRESEDTPKAILQHLYTSVSKEGFGRDDVSVPEEVMAYAKLFRGYVQYEAQEQGVLTKALGPLHGSRLVVLDLLGMRSRRSHFDRSDLDNITTKVYR
jgi:hypothetical protein